MMEKMEIWERKREREGVGERIMMTEGEER